jgi:serine/threonine protein kinase
MEHPLIGKVLKERYQVDSVLGKGGMATVFKGYHLEWEMMPVAIKVMNPNLDELSPGFRKRFLQREWGGLIKLKHEGIVRVYDFGTFESFVFIVMEFIEGEDLYTFLHNLQDDGRWIELRSALYLVYKVCEAIEYMHKEGWIHRDIKPTNIMLKKPDTEPTGEFSYVPQLTDLGLAKKLVSAAELETEPGISTVAEADLLDELTIAGVMGTPAYMAPEQALGKECDERTDIYQLGILLYELAVGRRPFSFRTLTEATVYYARETLESPLLPPHSINSEVPSEVEDIILKALQRHPADRYQSAEEMVAALEPLIEGPKGPPPPLPNYTIGVTKPDGTQERVSLEPGQILTIGRAEDNDLMLDDPHVSRHHARVEFDRRDIKVEDRDSLNGTYLDGLKLLQRVPQRWEPPAELRIGDHRLYLVPEGAPDVPPRELPPLPEETRKSLHEWLGVFMRQSTLSVDPGSRITASLTIFHQGTEPDDFKITVEGVPAQWVALQPAGDIRLMPGTRQEVKLAIEPPRESGTQPGDYEVKIRVASREEPDEAVEWPATLTVNPYYEFHSQLRPERIELKRQLIEQQRGTFQVAVENLGNTPQSYSITCEDDADELVFEPAESELTLHEGEEEETAFDVALRARRWTGGEKSHPFSVHVSAPEAKTQKHSGKLTSAGIPIWLLLLVSGLGLLLVAAISSIIQGGPGATLAPTSTPAPSQTPPTTAPSGFPDVFTETSESTATATPTSTWTPTATPSLSPTPTATTPPPPPPVRIFDAVENKEGYVDPQCLERERVSKPWFVGQVIGWDKKPIWGVKVYMAINGSPAGVQPSVTGGNDVFYEHWPGKEWANKGRFSAWKLEIPGSNAELSQQAKEFGVLIEDSCKKRVDFIER